MHLQEIRRIYFFPILGTVFTNKKKKKKKQRRKIGKKIQTPKLRYDIYFQSFQACVTLLCFIFFQTCHDYGKSDSRHDWWRLWHHGFSILDFILGQLHGGLSVNISIFSRLLLTLNILLYQNFAV